MSTEDRFGPIVSLWPIADAFRNELRDWMGEYIRAFERQHGIDRGPGPTTGLPVTFLVKHSAVFFPEESPPAVIVWVGGVTNHRIDPEDFTVTGVLQLGVVLVSPAVGIEATGEILQRYAAAVKAIAFDRPSLRGHATGLRLIDEDYERLDADRSKTLQVAELRFEADGVVIGRMHAGPGPGDRPRPDPRPPWPDDTPIARSVHTDAEDWTP